MRYISLVLMVILMACTNENNNRVDGPPYLNDLPAPTNKQIEEATRALYDFKMTAVGGGGYDVTSIKTLSNKMGNDATHYNVQVEVSGIRKSPPLANPRPDEDFSELQNLKFEWRNANWVETSIEEMQK